MQTTDLQQVECRRICSVDGATQTCFSDNWSKIWLFQVREWRPITVRGETQCSTVKKLRTSKPKDGLTYWRMATIMANSLSLGNRGFILNSSAIIQPAAHMSHGDKYSDWMRISGARYQRVTTTGVRAASQPRTRANPKSVIFSWRPSRSIKIFAGFRSRCTIRWECKKSVPRRSCSDKSCNFRNYTNSESIVPVRRKDR